MRLLAFAGLRYGEAVVEPGDLAAPPFDQIGEELRARLHAASPHQFAHLTRPDSPAAAARLHERWLAEGIVECDEAPALYPYETILPDGARRLGLCGLLGLEPPETGVVRPHERTVERTISERLELLRETRIDLEPILLLCDDAGELEALLRAEVEAAEPLAAHRDPDGNLHRLYRTADPSRIAAYRAALAERAAVIADGHHRWRTAGEYARETRAVGPVAAAAKLAVITSIASPGLRIEPIHRGLGRRIDPEAVAGLRREGARWEGGDGEAFASAVAAAPAPALGVWTPPAEPELWRLDPSHAPADLPSAAGEISYVLLHEALLPHLGYSAEAAVDGTVTYRSDPAALYREVATGALATGFWMPPIPPATFAAATAGGDLLPPKSTRFVPKLVSGLVWCPHDAAVA